MSTLDLTALAACSGGYNQGDIEWTFDLLMRELQRQAEEAERKAWQEFMSSQTA